MTGYTMTKKRVEITFENTVSYPLTPDKSFEYQVRILEMKGTYYWASRGMKQLVRSESGSYITFHEVDGVGYVQIYKPFMYKMIEKLPYEQRQKEIGYMEHVIQELKSITYFGDVKTLHLQ